jgi:hypothetical protein
MRTILLIAAVILLRSRPVDGAEDQAAAAIGRYLEAIGGEATLAAIEDRFQKLENAKFAVSEGGDALLTQYLKKGFKVREDWDVQHVEIKGNSLGFSQVYDGYRGWVSMFGSVSPIEGRTLMLFLEDKFLDDPLRHWQEDGYRASYLGKDAVDNEPVEVVELTDFTGEKKEKYFFSKVSGLLLKKEWKEEGKDGIVKKQIVYKNYQKISFGDGSGRKTQIPFSQDVYKDGDLDTTRKFREVKINTGLSDDLFAKPQIQPGAKSPKAMPLPSRAGQVKVSHILVGSSEEAESVRKAILEKGGSLESFMDAAHRHSKDTATKRAGGSLCWITRATMGREFSEAVSALKPGEISKPIKTERGWYLIFLEERGDQVKSGKAF